MSQGIYWILTISHAHFLPYLPPTIAWIRGQLERGAGGFLHWQIVLATGKKCRRAHILKIFGPVHAELSKSAAANEYVWKEDTRVDNTQFELGSRPISRAREADWDRVRELAKRGRLDDIPGDIYVRHYNALRRISTDHLEATAIERKVVVFWGPTGTGKSRSAWEQAGTDAYPKDPRTKFWCGYRGQKHVIIDEFRGGIDISHLLRWLDRYPTLVEVKGGMVALSCTQIWITSNLNPTNWYPELDNDTLNALLRRLIITHYDKL